MGRLLPRLLAVLLTLESGVAVGSVLPRSDHAVPATGRYAIGVNLDGSGSPRRALNAWCRLVGVRPAVVMSFQAWGGPLLFPSEVRAVRSLGVMPMVTWDPVEANGRQVPLRDIAAGKWDRYLVRVAHEVTALGEPVFVRFAHEMNLPSSPAGPTQNSPAAFVAAWRHVVDTFRAAGAASAKFVWSPNVDCNGGCPFDDYYPGDRWVDWAGLDGYNSGGADWRTLDNVFARSYLALTRLTDRPLMIAETASSESGGDKAGWIRAGLTQTVPRDFPRVRMVVWFDRVKEQDWRVNSSPASLAAFRAAGRSPAVIAQRVSGSCGDGTSR